MMLRVVVLLGLGAEAWAFAPAGNALPAMRAKLALRSPAACRTLRLPGVLQTCAHLDPSHAFTVADTLQVPALGSVRAGAWARQACELNLGGVSLLTRQGAGGAPEMRGRSIAGAGR